MKYLNLGCGYHYIESEEWVNLDFSKTGTSVIAHNLLKGIPFEDNTFEFVYHSHVLEHFSKDDGVKLIKECYRVLKPGGVIRIVIPNLEMIAREYLQLVEKLTLDIDNKILQENYEWITIEMYDQTVRNKSGGQMAEFLNRPVLQDENYIINRIGSPARRARENINKIDAPNIKKSIFKRLIPYLKLKLKQIVCGTQYLIFANIGKFRLGGEIHQWMYDRISLTLLLKAHQFNSIVLRDGSSSYITNWANYELDEKNNQLRKADSLYIEAIK